MTQYFKTLKGHKYIYIVFIKLIVYDTIFIEIKDSEEEYKSNSCIDNKSLCVKGKNKIDNEKIVVIHDVEKLYFINIVWNNGEICDKNSNPSITKMNELYKKSKKAYKNTPSMSEFIDNKKKYLVHYKNNKNDLPIEYKEYINYLRIEVKMCSYCGVYENDNIKLLKCGRCKKTYYCNKKCQSDGWSAHKDFCKE